jgi:phosphinothricin acetyltransferase
MTARRDWFGHYATVSPHRLFVASESERLVGFATSSPYRPRPAYETSAEMSVFLAPDTIGQGIGTALYQALFDAIAGEDLHRAYAGIALPNDASVSLHNRFGFQEVGHFTEHGRKFDKFWDVVILERALN